MDQLTVYESEARENQAAEEYLGPQCSTCGKNLWKHEKKGRGVIKIMITPEMGGCKCPPNAQRSKLPVKATLEERSTLALEGVLRGINALLTAQKIEVPSAPEYVAPVKGEIPTTGTPIDAIRAKQQKVG